MKRTLLAIGFCLLFLSNLRAVSALPFYEAFPESYGNYVVLGTANTASVWSIGNTGSSGGALVLDIGTSLAWPDLLNTNDYSYCLYVYGTPASNRNKGAPFTSQTLSSSNLTVYASFLFMDFQSPANSRLFASLSSNGSGTTPSVSAGVWLDPTGHLLISKNSNATPLATNNIDVSDGNLHLVVLRYRWNPGVGDDEVALWVDPQALGGDENSVPFPTTTVTTGNDVSTLQSFWIVHTSAASVTADLVLDEIRVATNWAGVTPTTTGVPTPINRPCITQTLLGANSLVLRGTNGPPNGAYEVLAAGDITALAYQWSLLATNQFDAAGNFDCTNPPPAASRQFYRLLVSGQISPIPPFPIITTQPTNQTVLAGQNAAFTVAATGDPTLVYQWYFNTNTVLSGATNAALIVTNAQFGNAGSYSVVVTNNSGSATSVVAMLTVNSVASGPSIIDQPQSLVVTQGQNAVFIVNAGGSPPLTYQWYFNTDTPLPDATNASLTLTNVQPGDAGVYSVGIANTNGSITSSNATLTVLAPPFIVIQPQDNTVITGQVDTLSVVATGTAPLSYQWYFNTNVPLADATNAFLGTSNAGVYSVIVTNLIGSVTSAPATVAVIAPTTNTGPIGFVTLNGGVTGGAGGPVVTASDEATFMADITSDGPLVVQVQGALVFPGNVRPAANKTIIGLGTNASFTGNLDIDSVTNVIVQNLTFSNPTGAGGGDGISVQRSQNVWIDHCTFHDCSDGEADITHACDFVTVSWCKFYYTLNTGHDFVNLIGHDQNNAAEDTGKLHVTFHHNWWSTLCIERMPRVRFGQVHVFNNYYDCTGNNYCVRAGYLSEILVENNHFDHINTPYEYFVEISDTGTAAGLINATGNATPGCTNVGGFSDAIFTPPYSYSLETPAGAKAQVLFGAGAGTALFP